MYSRGGVIDYMPYVVGDIEEERIMMVGLGDIVHPGHRNAESQQSDKIEKMQ